MKLYPAIDIKDGKCVRLLQGRADDATVYGDDPVQMAKKWERAGVKRLHIVDLDGAFSGKGANLKVIARIREAVPDIMLQLGGGIRSLADIKHRLDLGIDRIILGTIAVREPETTAEAVRRFGGGKIVAGIDARDGMAAVSGWVEATDVSAVELGKRLYAAGIRVCVYTDIARDGMLSGPNLKRTREMIEETGLEIIASGGVSSIDDLKACAQIGCAGAIVGKAMYDGRIDISEAIKELEGVPD